MHLYYDFYEHLERVSTARNIIISKRSPRNDNLLVFFSQK